MSQLQAIKIAIGKGKFSEAITTAEEALKHSEEPFEKDELLYLLIVSHRLSKQYERAVNAANQLLQSRPDHARAHQEIGHLNMAQSNQKDAAIAFYRAAQNNPALLASWKALHTLYKDMGNTQAMEISRAQIEYLSQLPREILGARDLMYDGELHKADRICRQFLQINKHHSEALLLLAEIGIRLKVYGEAEFLLESCLELHPDHNAAGLEYLKLLSKMGKFNDAKHLASKLLEQQPDNPMLLSSKASAMLGLSQIDEALDLYQKILAKNENQPGMQLLYGHALKASGNLEAATRAYQHAYQDKPDFGDAYWSLANTKTYRFTVQELEKMRDLVKQDDIAVDDKIHLHFALGKALEDTKSFNESFEHYQLGNQLKQQQIRYNPAVFEKQVEQQIATCDETLFTQKRKVGALAADPIFIVGLPRAGSTLLEQILASHSQVDGTMELHNVLGLASRLHGQANRYPALLKELDDSYFARFGEQFITDTRVYRDGAAYFIDKMPNNFLHIGLIKLILPNAKIIDARRHPMACCFSGYKQLFGEGQEFTYGLESIGRYYKAYEKLMSHWDKVLPDFVLRVQHEDVIDDLEHQVRRILDFCGLPFEQQCIDFYKTKRAIKTPSSEQVRQPIYRSGLAQWKNYELHLGELNRLFNNLS